MRRAIFFLACVCGLAQTPDPAYKALARAYEAVQTREYGTAIANFLKALQAAPFRPEIRKDLAYTYLKIGETALARDQFREAMKINPSDHQVALEYAYLCYETKQQAQARRVFDDLRKMGDAAAEQAFRSIDTPLADGIARWQKAIELGADNFSAHFELATLAEQRDDLSLAASEYKKAWLLLPERRSVLMDLGRVLKALNRGEEAGAALLAASRGGEPRAAEMARELLPERYPYVSEFRRAMELDPANVELHRELAYLLLRMGLQSDAEAEFRALAAGPSGDLLSATQLGFLLYSRGEHDAAMPFLERVLAGNDEELANRVRALLRQPQVVDSAAAPSSAKLMAERSLKAGYLKDAVRYLEMAHEADPRDFDVMLKLGWSYNILHQDLTASHWFDQARQSPDEEIASEGQRAFQNLRSATERFRTTGWLYPVFSSRWHDLFSYGQVRTEVRTGAFVQPYLSVRFVGDTRLTIGAVSPQSLSESSFIAAVGLRTTPWHGVTGWFEAGSAIGYLSGHMLPDYRGGVAAARGTGHSLGGESSGWFADTAADAVFISRFGNDFLVYSQSRGGLTLGPKSLRRQVYWNGNLTFDGQRQYWANFVETGPGVRVASSLLPQSLWIGFNMLRGVYLVNTGNPRRPNFNEFQAGIWYAFVH